ncbi:DNA polymerase delta subunit 2 [Chytriomyces hyalinus]|nr:DNA polymerase delta subunit 2 [Chytriomyces hyalinus]
MIANHNPLYENHSAPFNVRAADTRNYATQYAGLYFSRLALLRPKAFKTASEIWKGSRIVDRVLDIQGGDGESVIIAGTVFMDMPLKPCILDVVAKEAWVTAPPPRVKYTSDKDKVLLEDESGRLELVGAPIDTGFLVSGVVVAVRGYENENNQFHVQDICFPRYQIEHPIPTIEEDTFVAFVSGLSVGPNFALSLELQLLMDYLTGEAGSVSDPASIASICRVVVVGNSLEKKTISESSYAAGSMTKNSGETYSPSSLTWLDNLFSQLCSSVHVDVMPGSEDATNYALPQYAMPSGLFPKSRGFSSFQSVSNPYCASIGGVRLLGTSGQTIDDIYRYVDAEDRMAMVERTLRWGHMAPTAPDTLACYPFQDADPFIIDKHPNLYFIGNQPEFGTKLSVGPLGETTRIVLVPSFSKTKTIALVNLRTLDCHKVSFKQ